MNLYETEHQNSLKRVNTVEHEAAIREQQLQRISNNQSAGGFDNLSSEMNKIFKDSSPNRSMMSNNSQQRFQSQGFGNIVAGPFFNLRTSGQINNAITQAVEVGGIENQSKRNSGYFPNQYRGSRVSDASGHSSINNIILRDDSSLEMLRTPRADRQLEQPIVVQQNQTPYLGNHHNSAAQGFSFGRRN